MQRKVHKIASIAVIAALLAIAGTLQRSLLRQRAAPPMSITPVSPLEDAPPVLAFTTIALGSFRGLIANALWIRANDLQEEGQYFEMVQLADWITKLEPTFGQVWVHQAWNMAYNISVKFTDPADRWRWVKSGIELLRDQGLRYNPNDPLMYSELAWFFGHKIGENLDDAHFVYKANWAKEMTDLLGGGRPDFDSLLQPQTDEARQRAAALREKYKMDPALMKEIDATYGPLDWRLPEAHAIYWATLGLKYSRKENLVSLRRRIYRSMAVTVVRGRISFIEPDGRLHTGPDLSKIERANAAYEEMLREEEEKPDAIKVAHRNWLREVVYLLYIHNRNAEAEKWFAFLKAKYPDAALNQASAQEFALQRIQQDLPTMSHDRTKAVLEGLIAQHYFNLAIDEDDRAEGLDRLARQVWDNYAARTAQRREPLRMPPYPEMKRAILDQLLDAKSGLLPELAARLRTKLGLPAVAPSAI